MKAYIYLIILISIACKDIRRPTKATLKCLRQKLGKEQVKSLFASFRKYHRSNGKANFTVFINDRKPELKNTLEKCLAKEIKERRRLQKEKKSEKKVINLLKSLINDRKLKNEIRKEITEGNLKKAINICNNAIKIKSICKRFVKKMAKKLTKKKKEE